MKTIKKFTFAALAALAALTATLLFQTSITQADNNGQRGNHGQGGDDHERGGWQVIVIDVACDRRTVANNFSPHNFVAGTGPNRGTTFIVNGKIFPGGSIPKGNLPKETWDLDTAPGLLGTWVCKGTYNVSGAEIAPGFGPHSNSTQLYLFNGGYADLGGENTLISEGEEGAIEWETPTHRVVVGGTGIYRGVVGEVKEESLGWNWTGVPNIRFTFHVRN